MSTKIKIEQEIKTKAHQEFAALSIACTHDYYSNPICPDLTLELSPNSKELLNQHNIYFKSIENVVHLGRKGIGNGEISKNLPNTFPLLLMKIKVSNPRFWLVTDKSNFPKGDRAIIFKGVKNQQFEQLNIPYGSNISDLNKIIRQINNKEEKSVNATLKKENILGIDASILESLPSLDLSTLLAKFEDLLIKIEDQYYFFSNSQDFLGIVLLDLNKVDNTASNLKIPFKARSLKLRYKITQTEDRAKRKDKLKEVLVTRNLLREDLNANKSSEKKTPKLSFNITDQDDGEYIIESEKAWLLRQENLSSPTNFFKLEIENSKIKKEFNVFLPFPKIINPKHIKIISQVKYLEQEVKFLRFHEK